MAELVGSCAAVDLAYDYVNQHVFHGKLPARGRLIVTNSSKLDPKYPDGWNAYTWPRTATDIELNLGPDYQHPSQAHVASRAKAPYQTLVHELVHAWQIERLGGVDGALALWRTQVVDKKSYDFGDASGREWEDFNLEQQASIVEHWFLGRTVYGQEEPAALPMDPANPLFRFVRDHLWVD